MAQLKFIYIIFLVMSMTFCDSNKNNSMSQKIHNESESGDKMKWVGGEDGGSLFKICRIEKTNSKFLIKRYFSDSTFYSQGVFVPNQDFDISKPYKFVPICNSEICKILQNDKTITFTKIQ